MSVSAIESGRQRKVPILVVDDHALLRRGLAMLINQEADLEVCAEAASCQAALQAIKTRTPSLVIVDLVLQGGDDGLGLVKAVSIREPELPMLVLSMHAENVYAERALRAGARGYLCKQQLDDSVLPAIRQILAGKMYMSETLAANLASRYVSAHPPASSAAPMANLSNRELQVFRLLGQCRSTREIARMLYLSVKTIETYREHLKQKLNVRSAPELIRCAVLWVETDQSC